jgi:hypothetical protein
MTLDIASRISVAALSFFAVLSTWQATLAMPGVIA